jgi:thiol:disulfide interchange protein DsbD
MRIIFSFLLIFFLQSAFSQDEVVSWSSSYDNESQQINITAVIKDGWHLYSQAIDPMAGPIPTSFTFKLQGNVQLVEGVTEPIPIKAFDENFDSEVLYFEKVANFSQKLLVSAPSRVECTVNFMVCNDRMCLPPVDRILEIKIN